MNEVLITGSEGTIGKVLQRGLEHKVKLFDLPEHDTLDRDQLMEQMVGCLAVVHLAWNTLEDNWQSETTDPNDYAMAQNVYLAAHKADVPRVIVASSIHADMPKIRPEGLRSPYASPEHDSAYGANKLAVEALGNYYARYKGLEVVCIRFGLVRPEPEFRPDPAEPRPFNEGWISHGDCVGLVSALIAAKRIPNNYQIMWGLSRRQGDEEWHDLTNPLWQPKDSYSAPLA